MTRPREDGRMRDSRVADDLRRAAVELFAEQGADVIELESTVAPDMYRMYGDAWSVDRRNQRMMTLNKLSGVDDLAALLSDALITAELAGRVGEE